MYTYVYVQYTYMYMYMYMYIWGERSQIGIRCGHNKINYHPTTIMGRLTHISQPDSDLITGIDEVEVIIPFLVQGPSPDHTLAVQGHMSY